jgi:hypothetical protein
MLNKEAQTRSYDGIASLASYAGDEDPVFAAEGAAGKAWRSACWRRCYEILNAVKAGTMPQPTADELVGMMPVMVWPVFG